MGVAGEHEVDEMAAGVGDDVIGEVGLMSHEEDWAVGIGREGEIKVGMAGAWVVNAAEPETGAMTFDGEVLVNQNRGIVGDQGFDDEGAVEGDVVVA